MMTKSSYFSSKSVFGQLISLIDNKIIKDAVKKNDSDRYVKRFKSKDHLISIEADMIRGYVGLGSQLAGYRFDDIRRWGWLQDQGKLDWLKSRDPEFYTYSAGRDFFQYHN